MKWKTRDGRELEIKDMDNEHLINTIKYIERKNFVQIIPQGGGNCAEDIWYDEIEIDLKPIYNEMVRELNKRSG